MQRPEVAFLQAVAAGHATRVVHLVRLEIDARGLAILGAHAAWLALVDVKIHFEPREARNQREESAHGADGVAIGASAAPCQHSDDDKRRQSNQEGGQTLHPHVHAVECVAVHAVGNCRQQVVAPLIDGQQQVGHHAAIAAIRCQQRYYNVNAGNKGNDEQHQHAIAQPPQFGACGEAVLFAFAMNPRHDVLEDAQRTDDRTINAPEDERQCRQRQNDPQVEGKHCGQELDACRPTQVMVQHTAHIKKQQRHHEHHDGCQRYTDFS